MTVPSGYTQIPSTGLLVRNNDGSGPFYLTAGGVPTAMPVSGGGGGGITWDASTPWDSGTFWV